MANSLDMTQKLAVDANSLSDLKRAANQNSPDAITETAKQFEALVVSMMMKSMRDATPQDGPMDTEQSKMFTSMLDEQISQKVAQRGFGLAEMLEKQMRNNYGSALTGKGNTSQSSVNSAGFGSSPITQFAQSIKSASPELTDSQAQVQAFQTKLSSCAEQTSQSSGIPPEFMMSQAALETGWGKHEMMTSSGKPSHNVFGIKAGSGWTGKTVNAVTTEYSNGVPTQKVETFRAYDSYQQAFNDYAQLLQNNQRYKNVIENAKDAYGFAQGLQSAGYATDPNYANKLIGIMSKYRSA